MDLEHGFDPRGPPASPHPLRRAPQPPDVPRPLRGPHGKVPHQSHVRHDEEAEADVGGVAGLRGLVDEGDQGEAVDTHDGGDDEAHDDGKPPGRHPRGTLGINGGGKREVDSERGEAVGASWAVTQEAPWGAGKEVETLG